MASDARHSRARTIAGYLGEAAGLSSSWTACRVYHAGDTCVFGDMQLISRIYEPDLAMLPIGDHLHDGSEEAAVALELLGVGRCVPCRYGTFPLLTGTPEAYREAPTTELRDHRHRARGDVILRRALVRRDGRRVPESRSRARTNMPARRRTRRRTGVDDVAASRAGTMRKSRGRARHYGRGGTRGARTRRRSPACLVRRSSASYAS